MTADRAALASELADWARRCADRGWNRATSGNFSVVVHRDPLQLLITRSGVDKGRLTAKDFVLVDETGRSVDPGGSPSAETHIHVDLARSQGAGAVGHTHSVAATALSERFAAEGGVTFEGYEMLKALAGVNTHAIRVVVPVVENSQDWMADAAKAVARTGDGSVPGFLIRRHGLYAWGRDTGEAARHLEALEFLLEVRAAEMAYSI